MKNIKVLDKDYEVLMELSKELQTQDNNYQAFPYFWEPSSSRRETNVNDEGVFTKVYDHDSVESSDPEDLKEHREELWDLFLKEYELKEDVKYEDVEEDWIDFIKEQNGYTVYTEDDVVKQEHNPSLFKSDVKNFIEMNKHHLGKDPHTYARSIWRMPKMEKLVGAILRLNKEHDEEVNHEAKLFLGE